ncbi:MAG: glycerophosphodiester phosphodiesterase family protein [Lachnospiraceae bacterium]|nr:glycerophosphodiester phosphodiesterase family protein [Lachnospiraceae bacterium]
MASAAEKILIAAHRGTFGGNIPCNTMASYEIALKQGADVIEVDVEMSADGKLFIFHPGKESAHLNLQRSISGMTTEEISRLRYVNYDRDETQFGLNTFDEVLEAFKGRCYINVDKFWGHPKEIYEAIKKHNMTEQIIVKSRPSEQVFTVLRELAPELPFLAVVNEVHPLHEQLMNSGINYLGAEVLFESDDSPVASPEFIEMMHRDRKLLWVNSIIYDYKQQLTAGHSDDTALCLNMDLGWGWLAKRGFDFIQTDWTGMLVSYLEEKKLRYR